MMTDLPDPLIEPEVDIRGMSGFMLNVDRLLSSELVALATAEEGWHAFMLWARAWQQHPAGSLPNDERVLAAFSRAGSRWKKVRAMAMHGFVLCSDNRYYHPVLCEEVMTAWGKRQKYRRDQNRLKGWRENTAQKRSRPTDEALDETYLETRMKRVSQSVSQSVSPPVSERDRQGQGQRQGERKKERTSSLRSDGAPTIPGCDDRSSNTTEFARSGAPSPGKRQKSAIPELFQTPAEAATPPLAPPIEIAPPPGNPQSSAVSAPNHAVVTPEIAPPAGAAQATAPPDPELLDARTRLFGDGLAALRRLTGKPDGPARALLGRLLRDSRDDCPALLAALADAERDRPADPVPWLTAVVKARGSHSTAPRGPALMANGAPWPDDCPPEYRLPGVTWQPDPGHPDEPPHAWVNGWAIDYVWDRMREMDAVDLRTFRGDLSPIVRWFQAEIDPWTVILPTIRRISERPGYRAPATLGYFDAALTTSHPRAMA